MNPLFSLKQITITNVVRISVDNLLQQYRISDPETMLSLGDIALIADPSEAFRCLVLTDWQNNIDLRRKVIAATLPCVERSLVDSDWPIIDQAFNYLQQWTCGDDSALIASMQTINTLNINIHDLYNYGRRQAMSYDERMANFAAVAILCSGRQRVTPKQKVLLVFCPTPHTL